MMTSDRPSVITDLKKVSEALKTSPTTEGVNRLLNEWDALKSLVAELTEEVRSLKAILLKERHDP